MKLNFNKQRVSYVSLKNHVLTTEAPECHISARAACLVSSYTGGKEASGYDFQNKTILVTNTMTCCISLLDKSTYDTTKF